MKILSTKEQIAEYLKNETKIFKVDDLSSFTTQKISHHLHLSRSVTSQYLNELCKEDILVKVNSRPVYFFDKKTLEKKYRLQFKSQEFFNISDLMSTLENEFIQKDFMNVIGYDGSLADCIIQMKSATMYPPNGLPMILYGEMGIGKTYLVNQMYEYCLNNGLINKFAKLITITALKENQDAFISQLFDSGGWLEKASHGVLYIKDATNMSEQCQELLSDFIITGSYWFKNNKREVKTRIVLASVENPYEHFSTNLLLNIPVIYKIPTLEERAQEEKEEFVIKFFLKEKEKINKKLYLSKRVFDVLMQHSFHNHINELQKCITGICANAYMKNSDAAAIYIYLYDLPIDILENSYTIHTHNINDDFIDIETYQKSDTSNRIIALFDRMLDAYLEYTNQSYSFTKFCDEGYQLMRLYYDFIVFEEAHSNSRIKAIEELINHLLEITKINRQINLPLNFSFIIARITDTTQNIYSSIRIWEMERKDDIRECLSTLMLEMPNAYILSTHIVKQIYANIDIQLSEINIIFLMLNINFYNKDIANQDIVGIVLSHGYSTASSIADAVNSLLGVQIFEGIDMALDTNVDDISKRINQFIALNPAYKNIILMVDMGSLEDIGKKIICNVNIGVINNISTGLALNIGNKMLQGLILEDILRIACEEAQCQYKIFAYTKKERAIVFTNDAGINISQRLASLFKSSLSNTIEIKFLEYDYQALLSNGIHDTLFKTYDVILMIKPIALNISDVNSVSLEDIISFKDIKKVNDALSNDLNDEEIEIFNQQLLKNFSLESVMENLTILNASKLLDHVSETIQLLQNLMGSKFQSKTIIGIYIHTCLLIERLVTKNAIVTYDGIDDFEKEQQVFINQVNQSFKRLLRHYNVKMPISEIAYLYNYILSDEQKEM